jgi:hypothetical protein
MKERLSVGQLLKSYGLALLAMSLVCGLLLMVTPPERDMAMLETTFSGPITSPGQISAVSERVERQLVWNQWSGGR